ncbi:hypothetical protein BGX28_001281 [Mortierella sp. GBA30]|nr:hypothetical protein BGX28_001281 [Mortierella sp. GBA30]
MAVALLPKQKSSKSRSRQRSSSPRAFEEEDEDTVIISRLENEPWQPDLLLMRQPDKITPESVSVNEPGVNTSDTTASSGNSPAAFQGVIPVIIKSPSSVITTAESDCVESIVDGYAPQVSGRIQEYLQQTHEEQQRQQQEIQKLKLQYQLPARVGNTPEQSKRDEDLLPRLHRNSFHGESSCFLDEETERMLGLRGPSAQVPHSTSEAPLDKVLTDDEDVIDSLQSLKNLAMLALDGLLQQVVSEVTASDPAHNPDETTLQARALIRKRSYPLLTTLANGDQVQEQSQTSGQTLSISNTPIASLAASSVERLDELARKVDQLAVVATEQESLKSAKPSECTTGNSVNVESSSLTPQEQRPQQSRLDPSQVFESQEYQLACALAALLACTYRILNRLQEAPQQQQQQQQEQQPQRARFESADSGLDQASKLWKRLSSNSFSRNSNALKNIAAPSSSLRSESMTGSTSSTPEQRASLSSENPMSSTGTNGFMQSINKQVRTLRSRRTQSTSHIEVPFRSLRDSGKSSRRERLLGHMGLTSSSSNSKISLQSEDVAQDEGSKELERDWAELDRLMDEMSQLWLFVESLEEDVEEDGNNNGTTLAAAARAKNPFHDSNQIQQPHQNATSKASLDFDRQTLDMPASGDDLPEYDDAVPQYLASGKTGSRGLTSRSMQTLPRSASTATGFGDDKTRFDLHNVMSAIERLSKVAPRMDNQRVQLSTGQKRQIAQAHVAHTIERLSKGRWEDQRADESLTLERTRDLNGLVTQIVESAKAGYSTQRAELSAKLQWKLEGARIGDKIVRGEKMRMANQDWSSPETVLLKDMTRLTNALYQQSSASKAFATQRFTVSEDKARNMALQGIISKIERVSGRRMGNQDAQLSSSSDTSTSPKSMTATTTTMADK